MSQADSAHSTHSLGPMAAEVDQRQAPTDIQLTAKGERYARDCETKAANLPVYLITDLRREAEAEIERLIALLDRLEPDPDLEDAGDVMDDLNADLEPSLGWTEWKLDAPIGAPGWAPEYSRSAGYSEARNYRIEDAEEEHDGAEDDGCEEPSLGAREIADQVTWGGSGTNDLEDDNDTGIADEGGLDTEIRDRLTGALRFDGSGVEIGEAQLSDVTHVQHLPARPDSGNVRPVSVIAGPDGRAWVVTGL